jgi:YegS/Rv2252/BmrU family lipid kinase
MQRRFIYIINPISGTHNKHSIQQAIETRTKDVGIPFHIFPAVASGDYSFLHHLIKDQKITDVIIAGGDGTASQVINSFRHFNVQFGIIPCGSGNGLAFSAGIPKKIDKALQIIFTGNSNWSDAFLINDRFACMVCGVGFDAQVAHDFANGGKRGLSSYIRKTLRNFLSAKNYAFSLKINRSFIDVDAYFISIANSNQFGNNFTIAPKASLSDGLLDIVIMSSHTKLNLLIQTIRQVGGLNKLQQIETVNNNAAVIYFQTSELKIENLNSAPMHIDGEPVETIEKIEIHAIPKCFQLILP